jgi:plastocyanin
MRVARLLLCVVAAGTVGGCGGDGGNGPEPSAVFTTLEINPATVTVTVSGTQALTAVARDQNNGTMSGLSVAYASSDQTRATVSPAGVVTGVAVGTAQITATGTIGSVTKTRTVAVTVAAPSGTAAVTAAGTSFTPSSVTITPGGQVTWTFNGEHNVTFSTQGSPNNIPTRTSGSEAREFPTAGTYAYICTIHGTAMSGTVRVQ